MTREERIVQTFVELADIMVDDFDVVEFLHRLVEHCVSLLDCTEVGLLLVDVAGTLRVMASSSERAEALELLQSQNDEGPCFECYHRGSLVYSEDLQADRGRWPSFAPAALQKGLSSVHAIPMRVNGQTIGALNLFRTQTGRLAASDVPLGQGLADVAAISLLQDRATRQSRDVVAQLQGALTSRVVIEQAKGILSEQANITLDAAFTRLRAHAREHNRHLSDIAYELTDGTLDALTLSTTGAAQPET